MKASLISSQMPAAWLCQFGRTTNPSHADKLNRPARHPHSGKHPTPVTLDNPGQSITGDEARVHSRWDAPALLIFFRAAAACFLVVLRLSA